ncbi:retrovirus-related pol polyprotein from transposon TNT 1-94 [Tanacetum coccineum]
MKKTLKTKHPLWREAPRLHSYKDPPESSGLRLVLSIVAAENLHLEQLDVKTTFLHGDLDEDIYMTQPEGF